jgi:hypothetical protein
MTRYTLPPALRLTSLSALGLVGLCAAPALAGPTLVSRDSTLRAAGASAAGEYNLSNGSGDFDAFADTLQSDSSAAARSRAEQASAPRLDGGSGAFAGATADGAAHAAVDPAAQDAYASAESDFDVVFRVEGAPARVLLDCALDASGDASAGVRLYDVKTLAAAFSDEVTGDQRSSRGEQVLAPGTYGMSVWAFVRGTPDDSAASYTINLSLAAGDAPGPTPGPVPMPLPAAGWAGAAAFVLVAGAATRVRRQAMQRVR